MEEEKRQNPTGDYLDYLKRTIRNSDMTMWQAHQLLHSRLVAESYGLTPYEITELDKELKK